MGLLPWYDANRRALPWRRDTDPYRVLVSEVMLQQTRVATVLEYYQRWMARFPTVEALAVASEDDVMAAWSGLGYYRRARNLHAAAKMVAAEGWPVDLRTLPGVGEYTAGALGSISFGNAVPAIDGNAERVLSRLHDVELDVTTAAGRRAIRDVACVDPERPGDWNQAIMELGATVCTPTPRCDRCPVAADCQALQRGTIAERPVRPAKSRPVVEAMWFALVHAGGRVLLVRRESGLLAGTWGLPGGLQDTPLEDHVRAAGVDVRIGEAVALTHHFTHRTWHMQVHDAEILDVDHQAPRARVQWVAWESLPDVGLSAAARKAISAATASRSTRR